MPQSPGDLHYRTYLLAYDLSKGKLYDRTRTAFLCRAAVLTELAIRGLILDNGDHPRAAEGGSADDPVLAAALAQISAHDRSWQAWLRRSYKETLTATESSLQSMKVITVSHTRVLRLFRRTRVTVADRVGTLSPGLEKAYRGLRTTMVAAQGGIGGS
jgi:Golgi phosphoprotein 3 (GPP34)